MGLRIEDEVEHEAAQRLRLGQERTQLGTNPQTCPREAVKTPIPETESWHYSLGHWVEDDPQVGDGSFNSPGAFGFYPWVSADKRFYGMVAREQRHGVMSGDPGDKPAVASVSCGREIRAAWQEGQTRR